jgi:hypothetical protein
MRILRAVWISAALLVLSACDELTTDNPIGISGGDWTDARLIGGWKVTSESPTLKLAGDHFLFILPTTGTQLEAVEVVLNSPNPEENGWSTYKVVTGRIGEFTFANIRPVLAKGKPVDERGLPENDGYIPFLYRLRSDGGVELFGWSNDTISEEIAGAIDSGRLTGEPYGHRDPAHMTNYVRITANPQILDTFFAGAAPRIFRELGAKAYPLK